MLSWLRKLIEACWWPVQRRYARMSTDVADFNDELLWYKDLVQHSGGELSMALVQANSNLEDQSQVETGPFGTFVGIYDGHGGPDAAYYVCDHLYQNVQRFAREHAGMSVDVLKKAFQATEDGFMNFVSRTWQTQAKLATVGSCCLVGIIYGEMLYVANLGDSRAVMGTLLKGSTISALQLTVEHNASHEEVRRELRALHPDDAHIVVQKHGVWRVKGIIQISRSIGDAYLKKAEFQSRETLSARFQLPEPLKRPVLSSEPSVLVQNLRPQDKFIIFASDGLWEHLSNQEAAEIVHNHPRSGVARRLIRAALQEAAKKRETRYSDLKKIEKGIRRHFHDDITIVVVFLDNTPLGNLSNIPQVSLRGGVDSISVPSSLFSIDSRDGHLNGMGG